MNRKLLILDVVLGACAIYGGFQFHSQWVAAKARQAQMPGPKLKPAPPPPMTPLPQEPAVMATGYKDIAVKTLFDPTRTPDVPVEPPPPPPPPKNPPPLPDFHGMMDLGAGPFAIMSVNGTDGSQEVHPGGMIGPFKLLSFDRREMTLEWDGRVIHKRVDENRDHVGNAAGGAVGAGGVIPGVAGPPVQEAHRSELGPGQSVNDTIKVCLPGDNTAAGTVVGGYRKDVRTTPMGSQQCMWTLVAK
jgi:hypothetical protein